MTTPDVPAESLRTWFGSFCGQVFDPLASKHGLERRESAPEKGNGTVEVIESQLYVGDGFELRVALVRNRPREASLIAAGIAIDGPTLPGAPAQHYVVSDQLIAARLGLGRVRRTKLSLSPSAAELLESMTEVAAGLDGMLERKEEVRRLLREQEEKLLSVRRRLVARGMTERVPTIKPRAVVTYRLTRDDHVALTRRYAETGEVFVTLARTTRRRYLTLGVPILVLLTTCLVSTLMTLRNVAPQDAVLAGGVVGAFFGAVWVFMGSFLSTHLARVRARAIKDARRAPSTAYDFPHTVTVLSTALMVKRNGDISVIPWASVTGVSETADHIVVDFAGRTPMLVPLRVFETREIASEFIQAIRDARDVAAAERSLASVPGATAASGPSA